MSDICDANLHWLTGVENRDGSDTVLSAFAYTRRADGQVVRVDESVTQPDGSVQMGVATFTYDGLDRLTKKQFDGSVTGSDYTIEYGLDLVGNRYTKTTTTEGQAPVVTESVYDARDRLMSETAGLEVVSYTYDANGSLTMKLGGDEVASYDWDAMGRMASATVTEDGVTTANGYRYTADGIRAAVIDGAVTMRYVVDGMSPSGYAQVVEKWSSGESGEPILLESTVYGIGLDPVSQYVRDQGAGLFLPDGHSGPRQVVDGAGAVLLVQRWDAFGNVVQKAGAFVTDVTYRGERANGLGGGIYLRARVYDPATGRFGAMDPFGGNYGDVSQAMRYGYAGANPVWGMDPSGREWSIGGLLGGLGGMMARVAIPTPFVGLAGGTALKTLVVRAYIGTMSSALTMGILNHYAYRLFDELQLLRYAVNKSTIPQVSALSPEIHAIASKIYNYAENYKFNVMASPVLSQLGAIATLANINDGVGMILKAVSEVEEIASKTLTKAIPGTSITLDIHEVSVATYLLLGYFSSSASPIDPPQDISHARKAIEYINEGKTGEAAFETIRFVRQLREYGSVHFSQPLAPLT